MCHCFVCLGPPVLKVFGKTVYNSSDMIQISCYMFGNLETYGFDLWSHTVNGVLIRHLKGESNGNLSILAVRQSSYSDSGCYSCNAWNTKGETKYWSNKTTSVVVNGKEFYVSYGTYSSYSFDSNNVTLLSMLYVCTNWYFVCFKILVRLQQIHISNASKWNISFSPITQVNSTNNSFTFSYNVIKPILWCMIKYIPPNPAIVPTMEALFTPFSIHLDNLKPKWLPVLHWKVMPWSHITIICSCLLNIRSYPLAVRPYSFHVRSACIFKNPQIKRAILWRYNVWFVSRKKSSAEIWIIVIVYGYQCSLNCHWNVCLP